jgi:hypothetical protein
MALPDPASDAPAGGEKVDFAAAIQAAIAPPPVEVTPPDYPTFGLIEPPVEPVQVAGWGSLVKTLFGKGEVVDVLREAVPWARLPLIGLSEIPGPTL